MITELKLNKIVAAFVGVAVVVSLASALAVSRAHAVTLAELVELFIALEVIPADKADEARTVLSSQDAEAPSMDSMSCNFTRDLAVGATGADVKDLQKLLNGKGFTVAASGAGSVGMESEYYGQMTAAAVAKMQEAFASEILAPLGLSAGTGTFGPATRAKANTLCSAVVVPPVDEDEDEDTDSSELSGEATLDTFEISSADDDELEEGAEDAVVAEATFEFADGDAKITRVDVDFDPATTTVKLWDVLDTVSLWVDGEMVDEQAADDKDEYYDDAAGTLRFSGLDLIAMEDEELEVVVAVTLQDNVDSEGLGTYSVSVDSIRYVDADGATETVGSGEDFDTDVTFDVDEEGSEDEIIVKSNSSDPDASTIKVEDDAKSDWVNVFVFDIDTDDSTTDIELDSVVVDLLLSGAYGDIIDDAELVIDGVSIDNFDVVLSTTTVAEDTAALTFDVDSDVTIDAGDRVKAELNLRFKALDAQGTTVQASVASGAIDGEGAEAETSTGAATGDEHTLYSAGVYAEVVSVSESKTAGDNNENDVAEYTVKFDVTAFEDEYFVSGTTSVAVSYNIEDENGADVTVGTSTLAGVLSASVAKESGTNAYRIAEGDTVTFTLKVTFNPSDEVGTGDGDYRLQLNSVDYGSAAATPADQTAHEVNPEEDFQSDYLYLNA